MVRTGNTQHSLRHADHRQRNTQHNYTIVSKILHLQQKFLDSLVIYMTAEVEIAAEGSSEYIKQSGTLVIHRLCLII